MAKSLQDQLLQSGLVSKEKAKTVKTQKRKQQKQQLKNNLKVVDEAKLLAEKAKAEQVAKDKELNKQKQQQAEEKAIAAQIKQLIKQNKIAEDEEGQAYHFNDNNKVKKVYVSEKVRDLISQGSLAIVKIAEDYEIVPKVVAEKIAQRNKNCILVLNTDSNNQSTADNDPYADYQIPDDLMW